MRKLLSIIFVSLISYTQAQSQPSGSTDFAEICKERNDYFNRLGKNAPGYKQFKRWEWYHSTRLGAGGKLVDQQQLKRKALAESFNMVTKSGISQQAHTGDWSLIGPANVNSENRGIGRVNRIAFHPTNVNKLYLATATGGLWVTENAGTSWQSYTDGIPNLNLSGVVVDYTNPNIIYILTGDADSYFSGARGQFKYGKATSGILKSTDGGLTWRKTGFDWNVQDDILGYKLMIHPTDPSILLVATNDGIYRTSNGGNTWVRETQNNTYFDIEFKPGDPSVVYASGITSSNIVFYKSTDAGDTFSETFSTPRLMGADGLNATNRSSIAVTPANSNYVYMLCGPATAVGQFTGVFRSTTSGDNFSLRTNTPNILGRSSLGQDGVDQESYDLALVVSPVNTNILISGGIALWTSANGGSSFGWQDPALNAASYYHGDIHDIVYHPLNNSIVYMCGDGGIYRSTNNGDDWVDLNNNLAITQYYKIATNPSFGLGGIENVMIGGTQDNGTNMRGIIGGSGFSLIKGADGMDCYIDPDNPSTFVVSIQDGEFYFSTDGGASFGFECNPNSLSNFGLNVSSSWCTPVAEITGGNNAFIMGYSIAVKATKLGSTTIFTSLNRPARTFVKTSRSNANVIFLGDNDDNGPSPLATNYVNRSLDGGVSFTNIFNESNIGGSRRVTDLSFDPADPDKIWMSFGGFDPFQPARVIFSLDGGRNWLDISGSLPLVPVNCIIYDPSSGANNGVYIGTDIGVFYRNNTLGDWIPFSNNLPVVEVTDLEIHQGIGMLRAGTYGRGIWESSLYSNCVTSLVLSPSNTAEHQPYFFQASQTIGSTAAHSGAGTNVFYNAGNSVSFTPGFSANASGGNIVQAKIGPCSGGVPIGIYKAGNSRGRGVLVE